MTRFHNVVALVGCYVAPILAQTYSLPLACERGFMKTPTYGKKGAVFTICAQNYILGTVEQIYDVILDFPKYDEWNTFVTSVDVPANVQSAADVYEGMVMTLYTTGLVPGVNTTSRETITLLRPNNQPPFIAWEYTPEVGRELQQAEHVSLLLPEGNGVRYVSWETYYSAGALVIKPLRPKLQKQFEVQGADLKKRVESLYPRYR